ncbi:ABC transporter ATP-binding protein [Haloarculaceae archaeon H-GB11]|nr:ABC transporter ATP-binding protein [Haloarculaceae archaeon H-GB11]
MSPPAIETTSLQKRYDEAVAVDGLDLTVERGSVFGFLGPNGAGKTTTIEMLTTLRRPTAGSARVAGHDVSDRDAVVPHVGYLPEEPPLYEELTAREQLSYIAGLRDFGDDAHVDDLLERFELADDAHKRVSTYSKGMKQKLGLVQALMHDPDVVFLDEPTSGLDPRAARTVRNFISELAAADTTVFLSTHILPVVEELADHVGVLHDGRLVAEGAPSELKRRVEDARAVNGTTAEATLEQVFLDVTEGRATDR